LDFSANEWFTSETFSSFIQLAQENNCTADTTTPFVHPITSLSDSTHVVQPECALKTESVIKQLPMDHANETILPNENLSGLVCNSHFNFLLAQKQTVSTPKFGNCSQILILKSTVLKFIPYFFCRVATGTKCYSNYSRSA
jgi:hypothetical protein